MRVKAEAYSSEAPFRRGLPGTNALAYYENSVLLTTKIFFFRQVSLLADEEVGNIIMRGESESARGGKRLFPNWNRPKVTIRTCMFSLEIFAALLSFKTNICGSKNRQPGGLCYKPIMIVNDDTSIINKLETSLIDDARVIFYDRHMFIVQASGLG